MTWIPQPQAWIAGWEEAGYLVVENAVDEQTLGAMRLEMDKIEAQVRAKTLPAHLDQFVIRERDRTRHSKAGEFDSDAISAIMELPLFAPVFRRFILYPHILDILEALFGTTEFAFHNYKAICKMPGNEAPFAWHRDLPYLQHTTPNLITAMICLDDMTAENGATVVCPGSHHIAHEDVKPSDADMNDNEVPPNRVRVLCPAGSSVLFHANTIHGGGPNLSAAPRRNVIGIWAGPETYPVTGARYAYEFVMPRSQDSMRQRQTALTFGEPV